MPCEQFLMIEIEGVDVEYDFKTPAEANEFLKQNGFGVENRVAWRLPDIAIEDYGYSELTMTLEFLSSDLRVAVMYEVLVRRD